MILIDNRVGSKHYAALIPDSIVTRLESADLCFEGNGITIGIEVKKILDAVGCMYSGRLADHQIPLMKAQYDICYLIVEGLWRPNPSTGILEYYKGELGKWGKWYEVTTGSKRLMYSAFESWINTMELQGGILVRSTSSMEVTAALVLSLYNWWQKSQHHSFNAIHEQVGEAAELTRPTMLRRMIAMLPRVGWSRSAILAKRFLSVSDMVSAKPEEFLIEGEIAIGTAVKIWEALHNGKEST